MSSRSSSSCIVRGYDGAETLEHPHEPRDDLLTPHKAAALRELARIARLCARLVLTTWDFDGQPPNRPPQVSVHRDIARDAGFDVIAYDDTPHWLEYQRALTARLLQRTSDLAA